MTDYTNYYLKNDTIVCGNGYSFKLNNKYDAIKLMRLLNQLKNCEE